MTVHTRGPNVAIIKNFGESKAIWAVKMLESFTSLIKVSAPEANIEFFNAVTDLALPCPNTYDIIFLTGGVYNLALEKVDPWVERELDYIRAMHLKAPATKVIGSCWGHQAIARALGGEVAFVTNKHVIGTKLERLTATGKRLFKAETLKLPHFRMRRVAQPAPDAVALAEDNSMFYYPSRNIVSLQAHPEFTSAISRNVLDTDGGAFSGNMDEDELASTRASFDLRHDGEKTFATLMGWALGCKELKVTA
ncbi:hypothetical protein N7499_003452 [Penicillium canescens]|nr:uncharacterized protein N7446_012378 [Penicillium canescens]KAJ6020160.1 hypothetical protein N7522_000235 [Penicillium canescens]KAJ6045514.1 hypothetical protein N7446_012378 [Penicillium canescens]KAJ6090738.1 hypothetical protein N7499_003452 [Penicillium canescens]KAJ6174924.1 hypothetical protein N7485_004729 [Penicillium canescens]